MAPPIPSSPPEVRVKLGQAARMRGVRLVVTKRFFDACLGQYEQAGPGMTYLFVDATLRNVSYPGTANYGALDWVLLNHAGGEYSVLLSLPCHRVESDSGFANEGVTVRTRLAFEIPGDGHNLVLVWDGLSGPGDPARILVDLPD